MRRARWSVIFGDFVALSAMRSRRESVLGAVVVREP
jgi:hypothetical protein